MKNKIQQLKEKLKQFNDKNLTKMERLEKEEILNEIEKLEKIK